MDRNSPSTTQFHQFVLKIHSRCDLACDHCYVYESADDGWAAQPSSMSEATIAATVDRINEHHRADDSPVEVVLHGGEPLLVGVTRMRQILSQLQDGLRVGGPVGFTIQSNGVRLDRAFADVFLDFGVQVGISVDGGRTANDRHRRFRNGRSSYPQVRRAIHLLSRDRYSAVFGGLLCTIDVRNDPEQVLSDLLALNPKALDLLLPHATWNQPPVGALPGRTVYGDWLVRAFDAWLASGGQVPIRLFDSLTRALMGGASESEAIGLSSPMSIVIETDGSIEQTDALKVAFNRAGSIGLNVKHHGFAEVLNLQPDSLTGKVPDECGDCSLVTVCGGGLYPHRYGRGRGFNNPSVYCLDLQRLIRHVRTRLEAALTAVPVVPLAT